MKRVFFLIFLSLFISASCVTLPPLHPVSSIESTPCNRPFVTGQKQFVHAIVATLPGGKSTVVTGITTVSPEKASVHAIIMTLEGLVLFEGKIKKDQIEIVRSIAAFSSAAFADGLMHDVRLIFLKPAGIPSEIGRSAEGVLVCRYQNIDKSIVDVIIDNSGTWRLVQYDAGLHPVRRVKFRYGRSNTPPGKENSPERIELIATGSLGYTLDMQLIQ